MKRNEAITRKEVHIFYYPSELQTSCKPIIRYFSPGLYLFELYGDAGGSTEKGGKLYRGGKGGYTRGAIQFFQKTKVYMFIGGKGSTATTGFSYGGWNGGGSGKSGTLNYMSAGGGGSTDIRIQCSLKSCRSLVAGGGGGAGLTYVELINNAGYGGSGGGTEGLDGGAVFLENDENKGSGGKQDGGGIGGIDTTNSSPRKVPNGSLLNGGSMEDADPSVTFESSCGGGGAGYYGGGAGAATGGGGGSGYISDKFFSLDNFENITINGDSEFPSVDGSLITGNDSSGMIKITSYSNIFVFSFKNSISISFRLFVLIYLIHS